MDQPDNPIPPPGFAECLAFLAQNRSFLSIPTPQPPCPPAASVGTTPDTPTPTTEPRSFTRLGRGVGGALSDKKKVSKQITAPATKRKSQIDPDVEIQLSPPTSGAAKSANPKPAKRAKVTKVST